MSDAPVWMLPQETNDDPTFIHLSHELNLPTLGIEVIDGDGFMSPQRARSLAHLLLSAADYAEACTPVREVG